MATIDAPVTSPQIEEGVETMRVIVKLMPVTITVPEDWTEDQITEYLDSTRVEYRNWEYEDSWR